MDILRRPMQFDAERQTSNCNSVVHSRVDDDENKRPRQKGQLVSLFFSLSSQVQGMETVEGGKTSKTSWFSSWTLLSFIQGTSFLVVVFAFL